MEIRWDIERPEWDRRIAAESAAGAAPLQQDWSYGDATRMLGGQALRAAAEVEGRTVALAQLTVRPIGLGRVALADWALCGRGPVWLNAPSEAEKAAVYRALRRTAPLRRRRLLFFSPDEATPSPGLAAAGLRRVTTGYSTALLDLSQDLAALEAGMKSKWRNRLRAAERAGLSVRASRPKAGGCRWLLEQEEAQRAANGYRALPTAFVEAYQTASELSARLSGPRPGRRAKPSQSPSVKSSPGRRLSALRLFQAHAPGGAQARLKAGEDLDAPAGAMLFLLHGRAATYQIGWSSDEGKRLGAHNLLLWRAIQALKKEGVETLDLGGVDTERGAGIARFKLGSGARPVTLCGTFC